MWRWLSIVGILLAFASCERHGDAAKVTDLDGHAVDPLAGATSPVVLLFVATTCPISNRYAPEIRHIYDEFAPRGVKFHLVYPSATESTADIRDHVQKYAFPFGALRDPAHLLVARAAVHVTPEVAVFLPSGEVAYRGRIDDRQVDFGVARPEPTRRDLVLALDAILGGRPVETKTTLPIGCSIPQAR